MGESVTSSVVFDSGLAEIPASYGQDVTEETLAMQKYDLCHIDNNLQSASGLRIIRPCERSSAASSAKEFMLATLSS